MRSAGRSDRYMTIAVMSSRSGRQPIYGHPSVVSNAHNTDSRAERQGRAQSSSSIFHARAALAMRNRVAKTAGSPSLINVWTMLATSWLEEHARSPSKVREGHGRGDVSEIACLVGEELPQPVGGEHDELVTASVEAPETDLGGRDDACATCTRHSGEQSAPRGACGKCRRCV